MLPRSSRNMEGLSSFAMITYRLYKKYIQEVIAMKFISKVCTIILILLIMVGITYANKDRKGSSDHPLISRMPGFWIADYQESEYDSHTFRDNANNKINIEGHKYFIEYRLKKGGQEPGRLMMTESGTSINK